MSSALRASQNHYRADVHRQQAGDAQMEHVPRIGTEIGADKHRGRKPVKSQSDVKLQ